MIKVKIVIGNKIFKPIYCIYSSSPEHDYKKMIVIEILIQCGIDSWDELLKGIIFKRATSDYCNSD